MIRTPGVAVILGILALTAAACGGPKTRLPSPVPEWVTKLEPRPLAVDAVQVSSSSGYHAVFLKLSRFADEITHGSSDEPARIVLQLSGPDVGEDLTEERIATPDPLVTAVRVSRESGNVRVVLELSAAETPKYGIYEMADWVMVRIRE